MGTEEKKYNIYYDGQVYDDIDPEVTASELDLIMAQRKAQRQQQQQLQQQQQPPVQAQYQQQPPAPYQPLDRPASVQNFARTTAPPSPPAQPVPPAPSIPQGYGGVSADSYGGTNMSKQVTVVVPMANPVNDGPRRKTRIKRRRMNQYNSRTIEIQCDRSKEDLINNRKSLRRSVSIPGKSVIIPIEKNDAEEVDVIVNYPHKKRKTCKENCEADCRDDSEDSLVSVFPDERFSVQVRDSIELMKIKPKKSMEVIQVKLRAVSVLRSGSRTSGSLMRRESERTESQRSDSNYYDQMYTKKIESKNTLQNNTSIDGNVRSVDYKYRSIDSNNTSMDDNNNMNKNRNNDLDKSSVSMDKSIPSLDKSIRSLNKSNPSLDRSNPSLNRSTASSNDSRYQGSERKSRSIDNQMLQSESKAQSIQSVNNKKAQSIESRLASVDERLASTGEKNPYLESPRNPSTDNRSQTSAQSHGSIGQSRSTDKNNNINADTRSKRSIRYFGEEEEQQQQPNTNECRCGDPNPAARTECKCCKNCRHGTPPGQ